MTQFSSNTDLDKSNPDSSNKNSRTQKLIWISLAAVGSIISFFLSWPWWRDFSYWAESKVMWKIYFAVGFLLAVFVFYVFFRSLRTLFEHDAIEREQLADKSGIVDSEESL